jgi:hypothetical protein
MLPLLLALCGVPLHAVWRTSSGIIIAVILLYDWTYTRRRRVKTLDRLPSRRWLPIVIGSAIVIVGLLANALGARRCIGRPRSRSPVRSDRDDDGARRGQTHADVKSVWRIRQSAYEAIHRLAVHSCVQGAA